MKFISEIWKLQCYSLCISLWVVVGMGLSLAQESRTSRLTVANSTNATLTINVWNTTTNKNKEVSIPPLTELTFPVPSGYVRFEASALNSSPILYYSTSFAISTSQQYAMNLTPKDFGSNFLADRPNSGIMINKSRQALSDNHSTTTVDWDNKNSYERGQGHCFSAYDKYLSPNRTHDTSGSGRGVMYFAVTPNKKIVCSTGNSYSKYELLARKRKASCEEYLSKFGGGACALKGWWLQ